MITIKKYQIPYRYNGGVREGVNSNFKLLMPANTQCLKIKVIEVKNQGYIKNVPFLFVRTNTKCPMQNRNFNLYIEDSAILETNSCLGGYSDTDIYVDSFLKYDVVYHLFESLEF